MPGTSGRRHGRTHITPKVIKIAHQSVDIFTNGHSAASAITPVPTATAAHDDADIATRSRQKKAAKIDDAARAAGCFMILLPMPFAPHSAHGRAATMLAHEILAARRLSVSHRRQSGSAARTMRELTP